MNSVFTKFLKRFLGIPPFTSNAVTHLLCGTAPLTQTIFQNPTQPLESINLSIPIPGHQLYLIKEKVQDEETYSPEVIPEIRNEIAKIVKLPSNFFYRRRLARKIHDLDHRELCENKAFHTKADEQTCKCKLCKNPMKIYHKCPS